MSGEMTENWVNCLTSRIAVSSMKSSYKLVISGVLQGLILP